MVRRRKGGDDAVSLFPFLSILACVIGVLTLMIAAMALGQIEEGQMTAAEAERGIEYEKLVNQVAVEESEIDRMNDLIEAARVIAEELEQARQDLENVEQERNAIADSREITAQMMEEAKQLRARIVELEQELEKINALIEALRKDILARKAPPKAAAVAIRKTDVERAGSLPDLKYTFVECRPNDVVVYDGNEQQAVPRKDLRNETKPFFAVVEKVAIEPNGCLVFLIRPGAVRTYHEANRFARDVRKCLTAKLPAPGEGQLDLSAFETL